jgi:hypothetical protein
MTGIPRSNGIDADGVAETAADHFIKCPGCGQWIDMRHLGQVLANVHDAQIEIREGPDLAAQGDSLETPRAGRRSSFGAGEKRPPTARSSGSIIGVAPPPPFFSALL